MTRSLNKISCTLEPMTFKSMCFEPKLHTVPRMKLPLYLNRPQIQSAVSQLSCYNHCHYCTCGYSLLGRLVLQYAVVGKTIDVFSTQAVCMTPDRIMKAIQQGESFLVNLRLISLSLEANMCGVFRKVSYHVVIVIHQEQQQFPVLFQRLMRPC